jgi:hypothetical protein
MNRMLNSMYAATIITKSRFLSKLSSYHVHSLVFFLTNRKKLLKSDGSRFFDSIVLYTRHLLLIYTSSLLQ